MEEEGIQKIKSGIKRDNVEIDCLTFADDLAILYESIEDAMKEINIIKETAEKANIFRVNRIYDGDPRMAPCV